MNKGWLLSLVMTLGLFAFAGCAAPAPTATPTQPPVTAPTPTKAPTPTPTKRPVQKASYATAQINISQANHWLVEALGFLREEGLDMDLTLTGAGSKTLAGAASGEVDVASFNGLDLLSVVAVGGPVQAFMAQEKRQRSYVVLRKDVADRLGITEKTSYEEKARLVKGLTFAASGPNSGTDFRARFFLRNGGVDPDRDVTMTYIGLAAIPAALEAGSVDGAAAEDPEVSLLVQKGTIVILVNYAEGKMAGSESQVSSVSVASKENMKGRPEIYEAYVRATWRAMDFIKARPDEAWEAIRKARFADMDPGLFRQMQKNYEPAMSFTPEITKAMLDGGIDFLAKVRPDEPRPNITLEEYYTDRFVKAAKQQLGK